MALLEVENLQTHFATLDGVVRAVEGISFHIDAGETLGIVGESGCGKSVTAMSILRLIQEPPGKIAGMIRFEGRNLLEVPEPEMRDIRGNAISMIFQEPMTSLNPVLTVGRQIGETLQLHQGLSPRDAEKRAIDMLVLVGIPAPQRRVREYPHQLSGGMRQRVMIAMALACNPKLLIADEPTTALDVTIQAQILDLMRDLKNRLGSAIMLITHDLGVVAEMCQRVVVMYAGRKVEEGPGRGDLRPSAASLYAGSAWFGAEAWFVAVGGRPHQAGGDPRAGAEFAAEDRRLRVRRALSDGDRAVLARHAGDRDQGPASSGRLPLRREAHGGMIALTRYARARTRYSPSPCGRGLGGGGCATSAAPSPQPPPARGGGAPRLGHS